ncbi:MAG: type II toxin-antitoxin system death-on-curing family toxin [Veillonella sp.]|uniref:type II toxin-antitoxin system death-on-curing family toxin n=1 Tax=Veillonella TaxID=29465 RepID=UPI00257E76AE|nr:MULTISPECIES: type II toxin-antitoxin system death-on-curing family toxin [Veillonella]MBS6863147.1 Fic family protein [Veillonella sp.]MDU7877507.1 type II toxin-antitoxin system death-on-curing family toxin [Veillonella sp.]
MMYIELEHVISIHDAVLRESGGASGNINKDYINGILEFIKNDDYYSSFTEKLSYLVYSIASNHCFLDGNKRTAIATGMYFLIINDYDTLTVSKFVESMENAVPLVVNHTFSREDLTEIIAAILWDIEIDKMKYIYKLLATINN